MREKIFCNQVNRVTRILLFLIFILQYRVDGQGNGDCLAIMKKADSAIEQRNYSLALTKLRAFKVCSPGSAAVVADKKILEVFERIQGEKKTADSSRNEA